MSKQDELLLTEKRIVNIGLTTPLGKNLFWLDVGMRVAKAQLAEDKQHYEQKMGELDFIIKRLVAEIHRLSNQNVTLPIDIIAKARAELADLEIRKLKGC